MAPARTDPGHLDLQAGGPGRSRHASTARDEFNAKPSGNSVVLEEEMLKLSETGASFQMVSNLYSKHIAMLKGVLSRR